MMQDNTLSRSKLLKPKFNYIGGYFLKIILALLIIQLIRASLMLGLWWGIKPGYNLILFQALNGLTFLLVGVGLLLYFKPSLNDLSLNWDDMQLRSKLIYLVLGILLLVIIILPFSWGNSLELGVMGLVFGLTVPLFEELLFRGYLWVKVQNKLDACEIGRSGFLTLIIITAAFSLWHIGYMDVFLIHPMHPNLNMMLISKIGIGAVLGLITGLIRLKTGKVYGSFLFHAFWNTFAP